MPNLYAVHYDPVTWPEPEKFKPTRHLTEEGKINKKEQLIPFSIGKFIRHFLCGFKFNTCFVLAFRENTYKLQNVHVMCQQGFSQLQAHLTHL